MTTTESEAEPDDLPPTISGFAITHCANCAAGWVRRGTTGGVIIVCLLDRKPVWVQIADCDRYEPKEQPEATATEQP
jgi:hypothetical protein